MIHVTGYKTYYYNKKKEKIETTTDCEEIFKNKKELDIFRENLKKKNDNHCIAFAYKEK